MDNQNCPQCEREYNISKHRLVQDACGHVKCRVCLLEDDSDCKSCLKQNDEVIYSNGTEPDLCQLELPNQIVNSDKESTAINKISQMKLKTGWAILNAQANATAEAGVANVMDNETEIKELRIEKNDVINANSFEIDRSPPEPTLTTVENKTVNGVRNEKRKRNTKSSNAMSAKQSQGQSALPSHIIAKAMRKGSITVECFECTICVKTFRARGHCRYHFHCNSHVKPFQCNRCKKGFASRSHFEYHKKSHLGQKPHQCKRCIKSFLNVGALNRHMKIHNPVKPHQCPDCNRSFSSDSSLKAHSYRHSGLKLYKCDECSKSFSDQSNLKKHILTHTGVKAYMCDQCGRSFALKWSLQVHRNSHSKERFHECLECQRTFSDLRGLNRHILTHSDDKPYACNFCEVKSRRKDNLERHIRNTHPECINACGNILPANTSVIETPEKPQPPIRYILDPEENTSSVESMRRKLSELEKILTETEKTNAANHQTVIVAEKKGEFREKSNTVKVIKSTNNCSDRMEFAPSNFNAVPVINGPINLSRKSMNQFSKISFNNYSRDGAKICSRKTFSPYPSDLQLPINDYQFSENPNISDRVDIYKKILSPMPSSYSSSIKTSTPSCNKKHDQIERYKKILCPKYMSDAESQTQSDKNLIYTPLENTTTTSLSNDILNTYAYNSVTQPTLNINSEQLETFDTCNQSLTLKQTDQDEQDDSSQYCSHNRVSTIKLTSGRNDDLEMHWHRRTSQNYNYM